MNFTADNDGLEVLKKKFRRNGGMEKSRDLTIAHEENGYMDGNVSEDYGMAKMLEHRRDEERRMSEEEWLPRRNFLRRRKQKKRKTSEGYEDAKAANGSAVVKCSTNKRRESSMSNLMNETQSVGEATTANQRECKHYSELVMKTKLFKNSEIQRKWENGVLQTRDHIFRETKIHYLRMPYYSDHGKLDCRKNTNITAPVFWSLAEENEADKIISNYNYVGIPNEQRKYDSRTGILILPPLRNGLRTEINKNDEINHSETSLTSLPRPVKPANSLILNTSGNDTMFKIQSMLERVGANGFVYFDKGYNRNEMEFIFTCQQHYVAMFRIANDLISQNDSLHPFKNWKILQMALMVKAIPGEEDENGTLRDNYDFEYNCGYPLKEIIQATASHFWDDWQHRDLVHQQYVSEQKMAGAKVMARSMGRPSADDYKLDRLIPHHGQEDWCRRWDTEDKLHQKLKDERKATTMPQGSNKEKFTNIFCRVQELEEQDRINRRRIQVQEAEELQRQEEVIRRNRREGTPMERIIGELVDRMNDVRNRDDGYGGSQAGGSAAPSIGGVSYIRYSSEIHIIMIKERDLNGPNVRGSQMIGSGLGNNTTERNRTRTTTGRSERSSISNRSIRRVSVNNNGMPRPILPIQHTAAPPARPNDAAPPPVAVPEDVQHQLNMIAAAQAEASSQPLLDQTSDMNETDHNGTNGTIVLASAPLDDTPMVSTEEMGRMQGKGFNINDTESTEQSRMLNPMIGLKDNCICSLIGDECTCDVSAETDYSMHIENEPVIHPSDSISSVGISNNAEGAVDISTEEDPRVSIQYADSSVEKINPRQYDMMRRFASAVRRQNMSNDASTVIGIIEDPTNSAVSNSTATSGLKTAKSLSCLPTDNEITPFQPKRPLSITGLKKKAMKAKMQTTSTPTMKIPQPPPPQNDISNITPKAGRRSRTSSRSSSVKSRRSMKSTSSKKSETPNQQETQRTNVSLNLTREDTPRSSRYDQRLKKKEAAEKKKIEGSEKRKRDDEGSELLNDTEKDPKKIDMARTPPSMQNQAGNAEKDDRCILLKSENDFSKINGILEHLNLLKMRRNLEEEIQQKRMLKNGKVDIMELVKNILMNYFKNDVKKLNFGTTNVENRKLFIIWTKKGLIEFRLPPFTKIIPSAIFKLVFTAVGTKLKHECVFSESCIFGE